MEQRIEVKNTSDTKDYCNCCTHREFEKGMDSYDVRFSLGGFTSQITLCKKHLNELYKETKSTLMNEI